tara:strand:+ start:974 stop:2104 length:1131 start_codon:yes stop_codon:yes gene_type:complete
MNNKKRSNKRDIQMELLMAKEALSWKVKNSLLSALSRSYQIINVVEGKEMAIQLIWSYLRPDEKIPSKKITTSQKKKILAEMEEIIEFNELAVQVFKDSNPPGESRDIELKSGWAAYQSNSKLDAFLKTHNAYGNFFINFWEHHGYLILSEPKDKFLYDYLWEIEDFSNILFDKKALMCAGNIHSIAPPHQRDHPQSDLVAEICYLLTYAYLGILPTELSESEIDQFSGDYWLGVIYEYSNEEFLDYILVRTEKTYRSVFGRSVPTFLEDGMQAAKCRYDLDRGLSVSAESLSKLSGVDRKSIVNAKLASNTKSITPEKALKFLSQKARNRWIKKDEEGDPLGLKLLQVQSQFGFSKDFYPSVRKLKLNPLISKMK